jgi:hypothetical protein
MGPRLPTNFDFREFMSIWHVRDTWLLPPNDEVDFFRPRTPPSEPHRPTARPRTRPSLVSFLPVVLSSRRTPSSSTRRSMSLPRDLVLRPLLRTVRVLPVSVDLLVMPPPLQFLLVGSHPPSQVLLVGSPALLDLLLASSATLVSLLAQDSPDLRVSSLDSLSPRARLASQDLVYSPDSPVPPLVPRVSLVLLAVPPAAPPNLVQERPASLVLQVSSPPPDLPLVASRELHLVYSYWRDQ